MVLRKSFSNWRRPRMNRRVRGCRRAALAMELLECRALLASFGGSESWLSLERTQDDEVLSVYRTETGVQFVLGDSTEDVWDGIDLSVPGVSGHGGKVLTFDTTDVDPDMSVGIGSFKNVRFHGAAGGTPFPFSVGVQQYQTDARIEFVDGASHFSGPGNFFSFGSIEIEVSSSLRSLNGTLHLHANDSVVVDGSIMSHYGLALTAYRNLVINGTVQTESGLEQTGSISLVAGGFYEQTSTFEVNGIVSTGDAVSATEGAYGAAQSGLVAAYNYDGSIVGGAFGQISTGNATHLNGGNAASAARTN